MTASCLYSLVQTQEKVRGNSNVLDSKQFSSSLIIHQIKAKEKSNRDDSRQCFFTFPNNSNLIKDTRTLLRAFSLSCDIYTAEHPDRNRDSDSAYFQSF